MKKEKLFSGSLQRNQKYLAYSIKAKRVDFTIF